MTREVGSIMKTYNHFINGEWVEPIKNKYFDTENPFTGEV